MTDAIKLAIDALEAVTMDAVSIGAEENAISDIARTKAEAALAALRAQPEPWSSREHFYEALDKAVANAREDMRIKTVTMRCQGYDLQIPVIDAYSGHVLIDEVRAAQPDHIPDAGKMVDHRELVNDAARYAHVLECDYLATKTYLPDTTREKQYSKLREKHDAGRKAIGETK